MKLYGSLDALWREQLVIRRAVRANAYGAARLARAAQGMVEGVRMVAGRVSKTLDYCTVPLGAKLYTRNAWDKTHGMYVEIWARKAGVNYCISEVLPAYAAEEVEFLTTPDPDAAAWARRFGRKLRAQVNHNIALTA